MGEQRLDEDGDLERFCPKCEDWWPADREFFYTTGSEGKLHSWCKACYEDDRRPRRRAKRRLNGQTHASNPI